MVRVRGKSKKRADISREDQGSGGDDKNPSHRGRGRPVKPLNGEAQRAEESKKTEEEETEESEKGSKQQQQRQASAGKRKRSQQVKEGSESVKEESGVETKSTLDDETKSVGFRHVGSRRKNTPRRAAEVGVECK